MGRVTAAPTLIPIYQVVPVPVAAALCSGTPTGSWGHKQWCCSSTAVSLAQLVVLSLEGS